MLHSDFPINVEVAILEVDRCRAESQANGACIFHFLLQ